MTTIAAANSPTCGLKAEALTHIDINKLSQSELHALSLCSRAAVNTDADAVSPQLDRNLFNESAGSRRQTYSRLGHLHHRSRLHKPHPHPIPHPASDPVNHSIIHFLKHFINGNHNPPPPPPPPPPPKAEAAPPPPPPQLGLVSIQPKLEDKKRKRGRRNKNPTRLLENGIGIELERVNKNGEVVDLERLEKNGDELYAEELRRRTMGLESEDAISGFMWGLAGQWCSRRKKRKYVDAGELGDALPIGWKVLLGLRRRGFRPSVYCRRFISPTGQQFLSCKDTASFLRTYFGCDGGDQLRDQKTSSIQQAYGMSSDIVSIPIQQNPYPADKAEGMENEKPGDLNLSTLNPSDARESSSLMGIENLQDVRVQDIFECFKCKLTFDEKNAYLQHMFSVHQKTTKRYSVGQGVIIRDGKFECQFCHKVFLERRKYNGHVGNHVRGKGSTPLLTTASVHLSPESLVQEALPAGNSKIDALIEIPQNSVFGTLKDRSHEQLQPLSVEEAKAAVTGHEIDTGSIPSKIKAQDFQVDKAPSEGLNTNVTQERDVVQNDDIWNVTIEMDSSCLNNVKQLTGMEKYENCELDVGPTPSIEGYSKPSNDHLAETPGLTVEDMDFQDKVSGSSVPLTQSFQFFPPFDSNKEESCFHMADQKLENVTGFDELRFDDIESFKYGFMSEQESPSLPVSSLDLGNQVAVGHSVGLGSEEIIVNTAGRNELTTFCVWCSAEFKLESVESEAPSDSIGYMCPQCKSKISGDYGDSLSMDPHGF